MNHMWWITRSDICARERMSASQLQVVLSDPRAPQLKPAHRLGNHWLYNPEEVEEWLPKMRAWRESAPARTAAQRLSLEKAWVAKCEKAMERWAEVPPQKVSQ